MSPRTSGAPRRDAFIGTCVALCFTASGFAALTYEVAWIRTSALVFGSTSLALSTVLAVFFTGWALGSRIFGRISRRTSRPLAWFAALEVGLAACGVLSPWVFGWVESVFGALYPSIDAGGGWVHGTRAVLIALVLLPPTILMGGTLPLLTRHFVATQDGIVAGVGALYGLNTLGGAIGCAVCGFWLIPELGVHAAILTAAAINVVVGVSVWTVAVRARVPVTAAGEGSPGELGGAAGLARTFVYALVFAAGFLALGNEIVWARYLALLIPNTVHTYTLTLTVVLAGIGLGAPLAAVIARRAGDHAFGFGLVQVVLGLVVFGLLLYPIDWWLHLAAGAAAGDTVRLVVLVVCLMAVPAVLLGMSFPLALRLIVDRPVAVGDAVGVLTLVNTAGGVLGSFAVGFFALPLLGLQATIVLSTGASVLVGIGAWFSSAASRSTRVMRAVGAVAIWAMLAAFCGVQLPQDLLARRGALLAFVEGRDANLAVVRVQGVKRLEIDGLWQGEDRRDHLMMSAHVPMLTHPDPKRVLVVGVGTGQAARRFLLYDVERLDCIEVEGEVFALLREHFDADWMGDARVRTRVEDGRSYVAHTRSRYDVVSIAVGQTFRPGVAAFYTEEFYREVKEALASGGSVSQFLPTQLLGVEELQALVAAFLRVFPQSMLWYNTEEMLLVGRATEALTLPAARLRLLTEEPRLREDLRFAYWGGPTEWLQREEVFLGGFLAGPRGLAAFAGAVEPYVEDRPWVEYSAARHQNTTARQHAALDRIEANLDDVDSFLGIARVAAARRATADMRQQNLSDLRAVILAREVEARRVASVAQAEAFLRKAVELNPRNVRIRRQLALLFLGRKRPAEAIEVLTGALRVDDASAASHNCMGNALMLSGASDAAVRHFERAIALDPNDATPYLNLGQARFRGKAYAAAVKCLQTCLERDPENADAHHWLGRSHHELGDVAAAVHHLEAALRFGAVALARARAELFADLVHELGADEALRFEALDDAGQIAHRRTTGLVRQDLRGRSRIHARRRLATDLVADLLLPRRTVGAAHRC